MNSEETSQAGEARTVAPELEDGMSFFMKSAADLKKKHIIRRFQMQLQDIAEIILIWLIVGHKPFCFANFKHFRYYSDEHFAPLEGHKAQRSAARAKKRRGSHAHAVDESGGGIVYLDIDVHASQQSVTDLGSVEAALTTNYYCNGHLAPLEGHTAQRSAARVGESRGSQAHAIHESGGGVVYLDIDVHALQQSVIDQGSAAASLTTKHGVDVQNIVLTIFCALVVLSFTSLHGSSKGDYPEFIKLGLYIGYMNLTVLTFLALTAKKMSKVAVRVAAGMSITAVTIAAVYEVSDKVSIKCVLIMFGTLATLAIGVINWK